MSHQRVTSVFSFVIVLLAFFAIAGIFFIQFKTDSNRKVVASVYDSVIKEPLPKPTVQALPLDELDRVINARSFIVVKINSNEQKVILSQNEDEKLPVASLVKLMTSVIVLDDYDLSKKVIISKAAMAQVGEQGSLKLGETLTVEQLLYIALIESSNRAAYALSEVVGTEKFIALMNEKAASLGLVNTHFEDSSGLNQNSYSSAEDLAKLSGYLYVNYPLFDTITKLKEFNLYSENGSLHHKLINTNTLLDDPTIVSGKTGRTEGAKECFMVVQNKNGNYFIYVLLGTDDRSTEMKKLISLINATYK